MPTRPPGWPDVDFTFDGASGTINGAVYMTGQVSKFQINSRPFSKSAAFRLTNRL